MKRLALLISLAIVVRSNMSGIMAQAPEPSSIRGILTRWGSDAPIGQATVELRDLSGKAVAITATKETGDFAFSNVPRGTYGIVALAAGYAPAEYGQLRPGGSGRPVIVAAGQQPNIRINAVPGGSISGRVTNENGQPMVYSQVDVLRATYGIDGRVTPIFMQSVTTNDLGEYRAFWLPPGQYLVRAGFSRLNCFCNYGMNSPMGSDTSTPSTFISQTSRPRAAAAPNTDAAPAAAPVLSSFYSGAADAASATPVNLNIGSEVTGLDIRVAPIEFSSRVKVSGVVVDLAGRPLQNSFSVSIGKWPTTPAIDYSSAQMLTTRAPYPDANAAPGAQRYVIDNGKFEAAATAGKYQIRAVQGELSGRVIVDIGNADVDLTIPLRPSSVVAGRIRMEGDPANTPRDWSRLLVGIWTGPSVSFTGSIEDNGQFLIEHVIAGDYQFFIPPWTSAPVSTTDRRGLAVTSPTPNRSALPAVFENAYVKSIRSTNRDLMENSLRVEGGERLDFVEIVVSLDAASFDGRVLNTKREPVSRATVVLLPKGNAPAVSDRYRTSMTDDSGSFQFHGLPPGDYRVFSWEDVDAGAWFNPAFLAVYERLATSVTLVEKQRQSLDLDVIPAESPR
jgi:hypothetical protein